MDVRFLIRRDTDLQDVRDEREIHTASYNIGSDQNAILGFTEGIRGAGALALAHAGVEDADFWHARKILEDIAIEIDECGCGSEDDGFERRGADHGHLRAEGAYHCSSDV